MPRTVNTTGWLCPRLLPLLLPPRDLVYLRIHTQAVHFGIHKSWGRWDCAASTDRSGGAVRAAMGLIRGTPGTEDGKDPLCSVSCVYVKVVGLRTMSARKESCRFDAVAFSGRFASQY